MGDTEFYNFLIPLYGLSLGMSAGQIGILVGARSLLAVFLSIHVGVLMDRLGTRPGRVVLCLDGDGAGAGLPVAAVVLAFAAAAGHQWRCLAVCLVGLADPDRPIGRRRGRISRAVQFFRAHRHNRGADDCRSGMGFRRRLACLRARLCLGSRIDLGASPRPRGADRRGRRPQSGTARAAARRRRAPPGCPTMCGALR